jgi:hypothetical protein
MYRIHDVYIVDAFRAQGILMTTLRKLNRSRLYLQAARLSDIMNIAGTHMYKYTYTMQRPEAGNSCQYPTTSTLL